MFRATASTTEGTMPGRQARQRDRIIGAWSVRGAAQSPGRAQAQAGGYFAADRGHPTSAAGPWSRVRAAGCLLLALTVAACTETSEQPDPDIEVGSPPVAAVADCADPAIRDLVQRFGASLREVSLLAPDTIVAAEMRSAYAELVTPGLLADWIADPTAAPGRDVSSPWPQRIDIAGIDQGDPDACMVRGEVIYVTSADTVAADAATGQAVTLTVRNDGEWRISGYEGREGIPADTAMSDTAAR